MNFSCVYSNSADPNGRKNRKGTKTGKQDYQNKLALEQQAKLQKEKDDLEAAKRALAERDAADAAAKDALMKEGDVRDGTGEGTMDGTVKGTGDGAGDWSGGITDGKEGDEGGMNKNLFRDDDDANKKDADDKKRRRLRTGPLVPDTVKGKINTTSETRIILLQSMNCSAYKIILDVYIP